ncbi:putative cytochrome P450 [Helianthus annuus]|uniref:Cytochrome P450 n=1 Tax=Helianthus annuus TaxID=4232 RepID=A0A9K3DUW4_HELAN|nr:putative cytochrome P450 [Helianthus annuus]KAJ0823052.1 putative cytochrome P450 [Helianthus annuus]
METWFIIIVSLCIAALIRSIIFHRNHHNKLPPGPSLLHSSFLLLTNPASKFEPVLINLKARYGPIFTLSTGLGPSIFVSSHSLTHQILVKKGAVFSDRPKFLINFNISSSSYGPTWRLLRRNLAAEVMHPNRLRSYLWARKWAFHMLVSRLLEEKDDAAGVKVFDHFHYVMFRLLVLMCFGDKFDETRVDEIAKVQREMMGIVGSRRFNMLTMFPRLGRMLFRSIWKQFEIARDNKERVLVPIIKSRMESACLEGEISKLYDEIVGVVGPPRKGMELEPEAVINEEDLKKMRYLKAVVLEGLRRHPPARFVLPHKVMKEVEVQGYTFPQGAIINFMVGEMGLDPKVWDEPMKFKPERFLVNDGVFDVSGSRGIKMMPFGAGRRICPGSDLALLHLEYFVAILIWYFHWSFPDGYHVDLSEKIEFTTVMKNPLRARITSRAER